MRYIHEIYQLIMFNDILTILKNSRSKVKGQGHRGTKWPWNKNGHNSANFLDIEMKK